MNACSSNAGQFVLRVSRYGAAEVFIDLAEELKHTETNPIDKIHRLEWFAPVILISVTPMLQNLRIGLKKRRNGKSDGAREAAWMAKNILKFKEKHPNSILLTFGKLVSACGINP